LYLQKIYFVYQLVCEETMTVPPVVVVVGVVGVVQQQEQHPQVDATGVETGAGVTGH
jgi:hypothetical protein